MPVQKRRREATLLDLPDEALTQILRVLIGPYPELRGRSLTAASDAFSLAVCNSRLFALFRTTLQTLDLTPHEQLEASRSIPYPLTWTLFNHLRTVIRLAGKELRILRLARFDLAAINVLFKCITHCCGELRELSYFNNIDVDRVTERELLASQRKLRVLRVANPQAELMALGGCEWLEVLEVVHMRPRYVDELIKFLRCCGGGVKELAIGLDTTSELIGREETGDPTREIIKRIMEFVGDEGRECLQELQVFNFALSPPHEIEASNATSTYAQFVSVVDRTCRYVSETRQKNKGETRRFAELQLRAKGNLLFKSLQYIERFVVEGTKLEFQFPEAALVFSESDSEALVKRFRLDHITCVYPTMHPDRFRAMEELSLQGMMIFSDYLRVEDVRAQINALVDYATPNLKCIRDSDSMSGIRPCVADVCEFMTTTLHRAPSVTCVELTGAVVELAVTRPRLVTEMILAMGNIEVVRLYQHIWNDQLQVIAWKNVQEYKTFVQGLPDFLISLARHCPALQSVWFSLTNLMPGRADDEMSCYIHRTFVTIRNIEMIRPQLDMRSIYTVLQGWLG